MFELLNSLLYFREKRLRENLSQKELLNREIVLIGAALLTVVTVMGGLIAITMWWMSR